MGGVGARLLFLFSLDKALKIRDCLVVTLLAVSFGEEKSLTQTACYLIPLCIHSLDDCDIVASAKPKDRKCRYRTVQPSSLAAQEPKTDASRTAADR